MRPVKQLKYGLIALLTSFVMVLAACGDKHTILIGSGKMVTEQLNLRDFTKVRIVGIKEYWYSRLLDSGVTRAVSSPFQVAIVHSPDFGVSVTADDNLIESIHATNEGDTLVLELTASNRGGTLLATITMPRLIELEVRERIEGSIDGFQSPESLLIDLSAQGYCGDFYGGQTCQGPKLSGNIDVGELDLSLGDKTELKLVGASNHVQLDVVGRNVRVDLSDFMTDRASVSMETHSSSGFPPVMVRSLAVLNVREVLGPVNLIGAVKLVYLGGPVLREIKVGRTILLVGVKSADVARMGVSVTGYEMWKAIGEGCFVHATTSPTSINKPCVRCCDDD